MKPKFLLTLFVSINFILVMAQAPVVKLQKSFGGRSNDYGRFLRKTPDKGLIVAGNVSSPNISGNYWDYDYWF